MLFLGGEAEREVDVQVAVVTQDGKGAESATRGGHSFLQLLPSQTIRKISKSQR